MERTIVKLGSSNIARAMLKFDLGFVRFQNSGSEGLTELLADSEGSCMNIKLYTLEAWYALGAWNTVGRAFFRRNLSQACFNGSKQFVSPKKGISNSVPLIVSIISVIAITTRALGLTSRCSGSRTLGFHIHACMQGNNVTTDVAVVCLADYSAFLWMSVIPFQLNCR